MKIKINGKIHNMEKNKTLAGFIKSKKLNPRNIVVELNGTIVNKKNYLKTKLKEKDTVEIISFVGGG